MSIKNNLVETQIEKASNAGTDNRFLKVLDNNVKISTTFKYGCDYYTLSKEANRGASYPADRSDAHSLIKKDYTYSLVCYDAKTNSIINPADLEYEVLYNTQTSHYSTKKTDSSFDIIFNDMQKNELRLTVRVKGNNYLTNYGQLTSNSKTVNHIHEIKMVNINNLPDGVSIVNTTIQQNSNGTIAENVLNFPSSSTKYESATMKIPAGTLFYDKDKNRLQGDIHLKIGHFSPTTAFELFSPGYVVSNIEYDGKLQTDVAFISAGFWSTEIVDDSGRVARTIQLN